MRPPFWVISTASPRVGAELAFSSWFAKLLVTYWRKAAALPVAVWAVVGVQEPLSWHRRHLALLCDGAQAAAAAQHRPAICPRPGPHFYTAPWEPGLLLLTSAHMVASVTLGMWTWCCHVLVVSLSDLSLQDIPEQQQQMARVVMRLYLSSSWCPWLLTLQWNSAQANPARSGPDQESFKWGYILVRFFLFF